MQNSENIEIAIEHHAHDTAQQIMQAMKSVDEPSQTAFESQETNIIADPEELNWLGNRIDEREAQQQILIDEKSTLQAEKVALGIAALAALSRSENRKSFFKKVWVLSVS
ncbi:hypothetical protein SI65_05058 [Aspergillus cristatus]|uniref:Uncharacterized protein n=1 Tax=Aspergillus cristatus TaxID=573508 RepID=A0A1E3BGI4_ASPCR|nr:hypothetical protein SI65_05058 [Aspergillus cristatus]